MINELIQRIMPTMGQQQHYAIPSPIPQQPAMDPTMGMQPPALLPPQQQQQSQGGGEGSAAVMKMIMSMFGG